MTLIEFVQNNIIDGNPLLTAVTVAILFLIIYDFYHALISAVLTWFKK